MSKKDEALKLALEALEEAEALLVSMGLTHLIVYGDAEKAITALREALAEQPAQPKYRRGDRLICLETEEYCVIHISGTDRQWVKFPDAQICVYKNEQLAELFELLPKEIEIEQPAQQEPVAWMFQHEETGRTMCVDAQQVEWGFEKGNPRLKKIAPLYTTPPQRTWVGLTDDERITLFEKYGHRTGVLVGAVEDKLKEKNT